MAQHRRNFIFSVSTGRSGTAYLAKLLAANLPDAEIHHERTGYQNFGVHTPDASHFTLFNSLGNVKNVQDYWAQKLSRIARANKQFYGEASHFNAKAGLLENLHRLGGSGHTHMVFLDRDPFKVLWSYHNRFDFANVGFTWLFSLDPNYPNKIIPSAEHQQYGSAGIALWYIQEMQARGEYYRRLLQGNPNVTIHHHDLNKIVTPTGATEFVSNLLGDPLPTPVVIPEKENASANWFYGDDEQAKLRQLMKTLERETSALGRDFFESGKRLATPERATKRSIQKSITISTGSAPTAPTAATTSADTDIQTRKRLKDAVQLIRQNQFVKAQGLLEQALASAPGDANVLHQLGLVHARRGGLETASGYLQAARKKQPDNQNLLYSLSSVLLRLKAFQEAVDVLSNAITKKPTDPALWRNYSTALGFLQRFDQCFAPLLKALEMEPENSVTYNSLSRFYDESGDAKNALKYAAAGLVLKSRLALQAFSTLNRDKTLRLNENGHRGDKSVIAFSLWGAHSTFNRGAIENVEQAKEIFPDWVCRFYHDETVPTQTLETLRDLGAECVPVTQRQKKVHGAFWRFFVSDDPEVAWFICRDADCRPGKREQSVVADWRQSGQFFHIIRDHVWHSELMLAGLWGGKAGGLPNMEQLALDHYGEQGDRYDDQIFLAKIIWPLIQDRCLTHDSQFDVLPAKAFPCGNERIEEDHVGYSIYYTEHKSKVTLSFNAKTMEVKTTKVD